MSSDPHPEFQQIRYEVSEGILTIVLHRPEQLNALTQQMLVEILAALDLADADDDIKAIIFTGAGRAYCAGADISKGADAFDLQEAGGTVPRDGGGLITLRIFESKKPVIAAINGSAAGVGLTMTLAMDVRFVAAGAKLGFVFARRGIVPEAASSWFLPRIVGISRAMEWVATGRMFSPDEALEAGLVRKVLPVGDVLPAARALAREIVDNAAPVSVALSRRMLWTGLTLPHPMEAHRADSRAILVRGQMSDAREGVTSFLEKRAPVFEDRVSDGLPDIFPWLEPKTFL